jgi:hypothetical protein
MLRPCFVHSGVAVTNPEAEKSFINYLFKCATRFLAAKYDSYERVRVKSETLPVNSLIFTGNRVLALLDLYL